VFKEHEHGGAVLTIQDEKIILLKAYGLAEKVYFEGIVFN
jgi:hypothetical protein